MNKTLTLLSILCLSSLMACKNLDKGTKSAPETVTTLTAIDYKSKLAATKSGNLIDVRTPQEFAMNHIKGAQNINVHDADFEQKVKLLDASKPVFVYCKSGVRSSQAADIMLKNGLEVYNLDGGILQWQAQGYAVEMDKKSLNTGYTMETYNKAVSASGLVLVDFFATWCGPCKMMDPHIKAIKKEKGDALTVLKVDTDKSQEVAKHFKINAIPMVKLYKDGKEVYNKVGYHTKEELEALLQKHN